MFAAVEQQHSSSISSSSSSISISVSDHHDTSLLLTSLRQPSQVLEGLKKNRSDMVPSTFFTTEDVSGLLYVDPT